MRLLDYRYIYVFNQAGRRARIFRTAMLEVNMEDRLATISKRALQFRDARDWRQFHDPKNLAEAICKGLSVNTM